LLAVCCSTTSATTEQGQDQADEVRNFVRIDLLEPDLTLVVQRHHSPPRVGQAHASEAIITEPPRLAEKDPGIIYVALNDDIGVRFCVLQMDSRQLPAVRHADPWVTPGQLEGALQVLGEPSPQPEGTALTSGPRPRWVPMLDGLDLILRWYLEEIRPRLGDGPALFCDEGGGRIHRGTVRNRLACLLDLERAASGTDHGGEPARVRFSPHSLRHACATRNYERGVDLVAIQQMLGHWHVGTTMRYVTPSATFIEDAYRRAVSGTLAGLEGAGDAD
jgi:Phage integrase family